MTRALARNEDEELTFAAIAALSARGLAIGFETHDPIREERRLLRHPTSTGAERVAIDVEFRRSRENSLVLRYVLRGDFETVRYPAEDEPAQADELWKTTCFEVFVRAADGGYVEFNLAPSRRWAAYRFDAHRSGMKPADVADPEIWSHRIDDRFELGAELELAQVTELPSGAWRVGLSAVIEDVAGGLSYWALAHPGDKPDFHHPDSFVLELPPP